jgi:pimeloyl-ACP methyl ester carboxylesterase
VPAQVERRFRQLSTNGISLRAVVEGEGPLCILVHGWPESWYSFRHQIDPLVAAGYRVCVPDVRGYGGSDKPHTIEAYAMVEMVNDVAGLIDTLGERQAILIGHDWGAPIVWNTAIVHRDRVRAVAGLSVPHLGRGKAPLIDNLRRIYKDRFFYQLYFQEEGVAEAELEADVRTALRKVYFNASGDAAAQRLTTGTFVAKPADATMLDGLIDPDPFPAWLTEADIDYYTAEFERSGFRGPINRYRNSERDFHDLPQLSQEKITQPALFVAGTHDPVLNFVPGVRLSDLMDKWFTDLRGKVLIEGAGHWVQQEAAEATNRALLEFLRGL